jgi:hypothetical protein
MDEFVPKGYLSLAAVVNLIGRRQFGDKWRDPQSPAERQKDEQWQKITTDLRKEFCGTPPLHDDAAPTWLINDHSLAVHKMPPAWWAGNVLPGAFLARTIEYNPGRYGLRWSSTAPPLAGRVLIPESMLAPPAVAAPEPQIPVAHDAPVEMQPAAAAPIAILEPVAQPEIPAQPEAAPEIPTTPADIAPAPPIEPAAAEQDTNSRRGIGGPRRGPWFTHAVRAIERRARNDEGRVVADWSDDALTKFIEAEAEKWPNGIGPPIDRRTRIKGCKEAREKVLADIAAGSMRVR